MSTNLGSLKDKKFEKDFVVVDRPAPLGVVVVNVLFRSSSRVFTRPFAPAHAMHKPLIISVFRHRTSYILQSRSSSRSDL
jgi:uncharacterized protein YbbC (DUF1343 family)